MGLVEKRVGEVEGLPRGCLGDGGSVGVTAAQSARREARVAGARGVGGHTGARVLRTSWAPARTLALEGLRTGVGHVICFFLLNVTLAPGSGA